MLRYAIKFATSGNFLVSDHLFSFRNMARLRKTNFIENQSNLYNEYNIFDSENYGFLSLITQKV